MNRLKLLSMDLGLSAAVPYLAIWIYEASNWGVLAVQGYSVTLTVAGVVPVGVAGASTGILSPMTKAVQMAIAVSALLLFGRMVFRAGFVFAQLLAVSSVGVYLASSYWEMLSLLSTIPLTWHTFIFVAGTGAIAFGLLKLLCEVRKATSSTRLKSLQT